MTHKCIRESVISRSVTPVYIGSAFKNKGEPLLNAIADYLPSPLDREYQAIDNNSQPDENGKQTLVEINPDPKNLL